MKMTIQEAWAAAELPSPGSWAGISDAERQYRAGVLDDIARRVAEEGLNVPEPSADRGKQFMPFAALKGYEGVIGAVEGMSDALADDEVAEMGFGC